MQDYFKPHIVRAGVVGGLVGAVFALITLVPVLGGLVACFLWPIAVLAPVAAGVLAVMWGKKPRAARALQQGAIDGGIAGGIAGVIAGVASWIVNILQVIINAMAFAGAGVEGMGGLMIAAGVGFVSIFFWILVGAILGAIGGLVYAAIKQQSKG